MTLSDSGEMMRKGSITSKLRDAIGRHYPVILLAFLSIILFSDLLDSDVTLDNIHYINDMTFQAEMSRQWIHEGKGFPLWTPYFYGGTSFIGIPEYYVLDISLPLIALLNDIPLALNLLVIISFFLSGLGMYLLASSIVKDKIASLGAGLLYVLCGFMFLFLLRGHPNMMEGYLLIPFIVFLALKATREERWMLPTVGAGALLGLMILVGSAIFFLYIVLLVGLALALSLTGKRMMRQGKKILLIGLVLGAICLSLGAVKLLPSLDFVSMSNRAAGVSYQEFLGDPISLGDLGAAITGYGKASVVAGVGFMGSLLVIAGLPSWRKKMALFSLLVALFGLLFAMATPPFPQIFSSLPGFGQMRHVERAILLFVVAAPILAAYGLVNVRKILGQKGLKRQAPYICLGIVFLMAVELIALAPPLLTEKVTDPLDIPAVAWIAGQEPPFKVANLALSTPIGASGYNYYSQLGIPSLKGGGGIWINDYAAYLATAHQLDPARLFGVLGGKYLISDVIIEDSSLSLRGQFQSCDNCPVWEAYGPYVYENEEAISSPRMVSRALLVSGEGDQKAQLSYGLVLDIINLSHTVVIGSEEPLSQLTPQELSRFDGILLTHPVDEQTLAMLQRYKQDGGRILPDILEGKTVLDEEDTRWLTQHAGQPIEVSGETDSFNRYSLAKDPSLSGWVFLPERFAHFPGWIAKTGEKEAKLHKANIVGTALYAEGGIKSISLSYRPPSLRIGAALSMATGMVIIVTCLAAWKRRRSNHAH